MNLMSRWKILIFLFAAIGVFSLQCSRNDTAAKNERGLVIQEQVAENAKEEAGTED